MKILTVDVGTGTQDIFLYNSRLDLENGYKLVLPSPTMIVRDRLRQAAHQGRAVVLTGVTMGGGPSAWGAGEALKAGLPVYATPEAARSFNDDLDEVAGMGIQILGEDEAERLPESVERVRLADFDFYAIAEAFSRFGVSLTELQAVAVAVFDHGAAPRGISDRKFRFDYLDERIRETNRLSGFAYPAEHISPVMTRLEAVRRSAAGVSAPLVVMDTAPAAVLGATCDPVIRMRERVMIANIGNFHTLAFRLGPEGIEGVFEHHTGLLDRQKLETLLVRLADGRLTNDDVFGDQGHGALVYSGTALPIQNTNGGVVVTGPRRRMLAGSTLRPYFATPFGDMMISGCFGLLAATADCLPDLGDEIRASLLEEGVTGRAPWDG